MPYKDKNKMKLYWEKYYQDRKSVLNGKRTETRKKSQTLSQTLLSVSNPVSNPGLDVSNPPVVSQTLTEADIARKKLIEDLKAKISTVPAVLGKPYVPMKPQYVAQHPIPKMQENYSESVRYDYACM